MRPVVVTHALRTPIGKFLGAFSSLSAVDLGVHAARAVLERSGLEPERVDEVLMGHARQAGAGPNPARQVALRAGCPDTVPAATVNQACGSGLQALWMACQAIRLGEAEVVLAGGMESMTSLPFLLPKARLGYRLGHDRALDANYQDGFLCGVLRVPMGLTAEYLADHYRIPREEQDRYALSSFHRAERAQDAGRFDEEVVAVEVAGRKGETVQISRDEHPRKGVALESLAKLPPVFRKEGGTVHAGNSSGITDGAAALLVMSAEEAERRGLEPLAHLGQGVVRGVDPRHMGLGPVPAVRALLEREGLRLSDFDLVELNEAFAAQVLACDRELSFDHERLNPNGGAIALGHPIGASGARIVATLLHEMRRRQARRGLAALCMSGGMGMAVSFHRP